MVMKLRVEYAYDSESRNWSFRVPSLDIVGGADTRDEAERKVVEAVAFTVEGDDDASLADAEIRYLRQRDIYQSLTRQVYPGPQSQVSPKSVTRPFPLMI